MSCFSCSQAMEQMSSSVTLSSFSGRGTASIASTQVAKVRFPFLLIAGGKDELIPHHQMSAGRCDTGLQAAQCAWATSNSKNIHSKRMKNMTRKTQRRILTAIKPPCEMRPRGAWRRLELMMSQVADSQNGAECAVRDRPRGRAQRYLVQGRDTVLPRADGEFLRLSNPRELSHPQ